MPANRTFAAATLACSLLTMSACPTNSAPPAVVPPAEFIALGVTAPYLSGAVVGGQRARAAKMRAAKIAPIAPYAVPSYMADLAGELRRQTAGIGLDVLQVGDGIVIRIPAALTFDAGSAGLKPQFDATLLEISRTVKTRSRTYVDVYAHTDTSGTPAGNQALSDKRAAAVAAYLAGHGVARARIASRGLGESAPLYNPDDTPTKQAANRRVEIRLAPYRG
jgi:outer membrane protein OmpA-like peptidoglycan-associated protein